METNFTYCPFCGREVAKLIIEGPVDHIRMLESSPKDIAFVELIEHYFKQGLACQKILCIENLWHQNVVTYVQYKALTPWFIGSKNRDYNLDCVRRRVQ